MLNRNNHVEFTFENKYGEEVTIEVSVYHCYYYEVDKNLPTNKLRYTQKEKDQLVDELEAKDISNEVDPEDIINEHLEDSDFVNWLIENYEEL